MRQAFHGGAFFEAIGEEFSTLDRSKKIINADVLDARFDPSPKAIQKIKEYLGFIIRTSPPIHSEGLIKKISEIREIPQKNIIVNGGSSDIMFSIFLQLINKESKVLILDPMYGEYAHIFENIIESKLYRFRLSKENNFEIDLVALQKEIQNISPDMVVLVNPNNPTGKYYEKENILNLIRTSSNKILFVVDEAYIDYLDSEKSLEKDAIKLNNLIIIKSMSKAYALSGIRVAYMIANEKIIEKLVPFIPPRSVSLVGQIAAVEALKDRKYYQKKYNQTNDLREQFIYSLKDIPSIKIYNSVANFFLIELKNSRYSAKNIIAKLIKQNIYLRNCDSMSKQFADNFIRIAVKDIGSNKIIIKALQEQFRK